MPLRLEFEISRVLADVHILNIFKGAAEIKAQVMAGVCRRVSDSPAPPDEIPPGVIYPLI